MNDVPMIKSVHFSNFRALRDATLPLGPFTLIVGPNGSGKSTAMQAFRFICSEFDRRRQDWITVGSERSSRVTVHVNWVENGSEFFTTALLGPIGVELTTSSE